MTFAYEIAPFNTISIIFFVEGGTLLCDNLPLFFRLSPLQDIFTDHELHELCILTDIKKHPKSTINYFSR
jgi:hypothetical protein